MTPTDYAEYYAMILGRTETEVAEDARLGGCSVRAWVSSADEAASAAGMRTGAHGAEWLARAIHDVEGAADRATLSDLMDDLLELGHLDLAASVANCGTLDDLSVCEWSPEEHAILAALGWQP